MRKIWIIAQKELNRTFTDRSLLVIMLAAPLAIATIIGLAFGYLGGGDVPIKDIPVAIVNQDTGTAQQNYGAIFVGAFIPSDASTAAVAAQPTCPTASTTTSTNATTLQDLTNAVTLDDPAAARAGVDTGKYAAAIIIPVDFSKKISYGGPSDPVEPASVEIYANSGEQISAGIIRSIVESIGTSIATGNVAVASTLDTITKNYGLVQMGKVASSAAFAQNIACGFSASLNTLTIEQKSVAGRKSNSTADILVLFGSAQAMFFTLFTGQQGVLSILEERKQGTLQRLIVSPTPRLYILLGKLIGTFVTCFAQLAILFIALTGVASVLTGEPVGIWGGNVFLLVLMIAAAAIASTGLGTLLAGIAKTPEQSQIFAQIINIAFAILGGAFGFQLGEGISRFSIIYWGTNAFQKLSANQADIGLNLAVLLIFGVGSFLLGFWLFNRRLDI